MFMNGSLSLPVPRAFAASRSNRLACWSVSFGERYTARARGGRTMLPSAPAAVTVVQRVTPTRRRSTRMPVRDRLNEGTPGDQIFVRDRSEAPCQPLSFETGGIFLPEIRNNSEARLSQEAQMSGVRLAIQQPSSPAVNDLPFQFGIGPVPVPGRGAA
jgi:hypothetical protein